MLISKFYALQNALDRLASFDLKTSLLGFLKDPDPPDFTQKEAEEISARLAPFADYRLSYRIFILDSNDPNAQASLNGNECHIEISRGLWRQTGFWNFKETLVKKGDMHEFASVIGHEMAHCSKYHAQFNQYSEEARDDAQIFLERNVASLQTSLLNYLSKKQITTEEQLFRAAGEDSDLLKLYLSTLSAGPHSKELEADYLGMIYMIQAGYDAEAAIRMWSRMSNSDDGTFGDHPTNTERTKFLKEHLSEVMTHAQCQLEDKIACVDISPVCKFSGKETALH